MGQQAPGTSISAKRSFDAGAVLSRAFRLWSQNAVKFGLLSIVLLSPLFIVEGGTQFMAAQAGGVPVAGNWEFEIGIWALTSLLSNLVTGSVVFGVLRSLKHDPVSAKECFSEGFKKLVPILVAGFIAGLVVALPIGIAALVGTVLPGAFGILALAPGVIYSIMLMIGYWVLVPIVVVENVGGKEALTRSWNLTDGFKRQIFGICFVVGLLGGGITIFINMIASFSPVLTSGLTMLGTAISISLSAVVVAVTYHDLRVAKEGADTDQLAAVFD